MASSDIDIPVPESLKPIRPYLLLAKQHDSKYKVVSYFCLRYAMETAMRLDKRDAEGKKFLFALMDALESRKKELADNEVFQNEVVCNSHVEDHALKIFLYADNEDRAGRFNQNVVKSFYKAGLLMDVLQTFGELSEQIQAQKKYAKYKAANISACLKRGETPKPGPPGDDEEGNFLPSDGASASQGPGIPPAHPNLYPPGQPPTEMYPPANSYPPQQPTNMPPPQHPAPVPRHMNAGTPTNQTQPGAFAPPTTPEQPPAGAMQPARTNSIQFAPEDYSKATKFCKFAISALQYEDVPTAIKNLEDALRLLKTGSV